MIRQVLSFNNDVISATFWFMPEWPYVSVLLSLLDILLLVLMDVDICGIGVGSFVYIIQNLFLDYFSLL